MFNCTFQETIKNQFINIITWTILLFILSNFILYGMNTLPFSPDSWSYWELSKTIFSGDFYKIHGWRQFQTIEEYSMSFPPLWPVLISVFSLISSVGPASMPLIAGMCFLVGVIFLEKIFTQYFNIKYLGVLGGFFLLCYAPFYEEIIAGRSIPLAFMLTVIVLNLWFNSVSLLNTIKLGFFSGLIILTRFDMLPFIAILGVGLYVNKYILSRDEVDYKFTLLFYFVVFLVISPYIIYSFIHFNRFFATDNSIVAKSAYPMYVTYYNSVELPTLFEEPAKWVLRILKNTYRLIRNEVRLLLIFLAGLTVSFFYIRKNDKNIDAFLVFIFSYSMSLSTYVLTGYFDKRYFSMMVLFTFILIFINLYNKFSFKTQRFVFSAIGSMAVFYSVGIVSYHHVIPTQLKYSPMTEKEKIISNGLSEVAMCHRSSSEHDKILFSNSIDALLISSALGINTSLIPRNFSDLTDKDKSFFLKMYNITAYYGDKPKDIESIKALENFHFEECEYDRKFKYLIGVGS